MVSVDADQNHLWVVLDSFPIVIALGFEGKLLLLRKCADAAVGRHALLALRCLGIARMVTGSEFLR